MQALDRLWRGELLHGEDHLQSDQEYQKLQTTFAGRMDDLMSRLADSDRERLEDCVNLQFELQDIESRESFIEGFRIGAGIILDVIG